MSAGYSGTPLAKKLGIKPGARVALLGAPAGFAETLAGLPEDAIVRTSLRGSDMDVIVWFPRSARDLEDRFASVRGRLADAGGLWIAWPKKASGVPSDLGDGVVRQIGLHAGLVDNKVCAISEVYSGLRFVVRLKDRK